MSKTLNACVRFANFSQFHGINTADLADLIGLAHRAYSAGEREANTNASAERARDRFERKAKALGYGVCWYGLWPTLRRNERDIELPAL